MPFNENRVFIPEVPHSTRGASSAHRWLKCAGSIQLANKIERAGTKIRRSGPAAAEGTVAHTVLSTALEDGSDAWEFAGMEFNVGDWNFTVNDEMQQGVQVCLDLVASILRQYKGKNPKVFIEKQLNSVLHDDAWGTPDVIILIPGERIIVIDFKYGRGVTVEPTSAQNRYYGYLACENYLKTFSDVAEVELWIAQPRIPHPGGLCRKFVTTPQELEDWWLKVLIPGIEETHNPDANLLIGDHCRFCPARDACPALKREVFEFALEIEPDHLTTPEIGEMLQKRDAIVKYFERVEQEAFKRAMNGETVPGQKIVRKKANRIFKEQIVQPNLDDPDHPVVLKLEDTAKALFGSAAYTEPTLKSPPQIEKLDGGKAFVSTWAYKPETGLTLASDTDKRPAVKRTMVAFQEQMEAGDPDSLDGGPY